MENDGLVFGADSIETQEIAGQAEYRGVRVRFTGYLGNAQVRMQIDVGVGDVVTPPESEITYPTLLDFSHPKLKAYPKETVVAEKTEAMVRLGEINSRMQDFFDLWLLSRHFSFEGRLLAEAVRRTFTNRGTEIPASPTCLGDDFAANRTTQSQWSAFVTRNRLEAVPDDFIVIVQAVAEFIEPVLDALNAGESFDVRWEPGGPWKGRRASP